MQPETDRDTSSPLFVSEETTHPYPDLPDGPGSIPNPQAPYGINPDTGRPYTKSPEERAEFGRRMAAARANRAQGAPGRQPPRRKASAARPAGRSRANARQEAPLPPEQSYALAAAGVLSLVPIGLSLAARIFKSEVLALDSIAVDRAIPDMAGAVGEIAVNEARLAVLLDKVSEVGPWGKLAMLGMPLALQLAANHRLVQPSAEMGILSADELWATVTPPPEE